MFSDERVLDTEYYVARAMHCFGNYDSAVTIYKKLIEKFEFDRNERKQITVLEDLGLLYQEQGHFKKAKRLFMQVTQLRGD